MFNSLNIIKYKTNTEREREKDRATKKAHKINNNNMPPLFWNGNIFLNEKFLNKKKTETIQKQNFIFIMLVYARAG